MSAFVLLDLVSSRRGHAKLVVGKSVSEVTPFEVE